MKISRLLSLLAVLAFSAATTQAATVNWGAATNITGDSDVSTNGTLVGAFNVGPVGVANTTVNGTLFTAMGVSGSSVTIGNFNLTTASGNFSWGTHTSPNAPYANLSAAYRAMLSTIASSQFGPFTLTMSGLVTGMTYEFQFWSNSPGAFTTPTTATAGNSVTLSSNTTGLDGGLGQFAIGTFIADSASEQITFSTTNLLYLNGFQLRQLGQATVPEAGSSIALLFLSAGALFGARRLCARPRLG